MPEKKPTEEAKDRMEELLSAPTGVEGPLQEVPIVCAHCGHKMLMRPTGEIKLTSPPKIAKGWWCGLCNKWHGIRTYSIPEDERYLEAWRTLNELGGRRRG